MRETLTQFRLLTLLALTLLVALSCTRLTKQRRADELMRKKGAKSETAVDHTKKSKVTSPNLDLTIPANAYNEDVVVSIGSVTDALFQELAKLPESASLLSTPVEVITRSSTTDQKVEPSLPLSAEIRLKSSAELDEESIALVLVKDPETGDYKIFYVPYEDYKIITSESGTPIGIEIEKLKSGNFITAMVTGVDKTYIEQNYEKLPEDGSVDSKAKVPPQFGPTSIAFTDTDNDGGQIAGNLTIVKASDESDIDSYVVYWGTSATEKQSANAITTISKTGSNLTYTFSANTTVPASPLATHILVCSKNSVGERTPCASMQFVDLGLPAFAATSVAFTDTDTDGGKIGGTLAIGKASDESDITHYVLYWGTTTTQKQSNTALATIPVTGANINYNIAAGTTIPAWPQVTQLLVYTKNDDGEMATGVAVALVDLGVPTHQAAGIVFTDGDLDVGEVSGNLTITKATNESDVSDYVLYWGNSASTKLSATPITTETVTGSDIVYAIGANEPVPSGATHFLVYTKNTEGEMIAGVALLLVDRGLPIHAAASVSFTDTDPTGGEIAGNLQITKASSEADVTSYKVYWGSNATTKQNGTAITTIAKTGSNLSYTFAADTVIPTGPAATHILVYTNNADGEMATPTAVAIVDLGVPVNAATGVAFSDGDADGGQLSGMVTITKASNESDVTHYVLYWGTNATTKRSATPIATIAKTGSNVTYTFPANTAIPTGPAATRLLVYTKNAVGEMATPYAYAFTDVGGSLCSATENSNSPFANWTGGTDPGGAIVICTVDQFKRITDATTYSGVTPVQRLARNYVLHESIDLAGETFTKIGNMTNEFSGTFDGNGFTLENVTMVGTEDRVGIFGVVSTTGVVKDLNVTLVSVSGASYNYVGGLAGVFYGKLENVHVSGASGASTEVVVGNEYVGGMIGYYSGDGSTRVITKSSVENLIVRSARSGGSDMGGFVGYVISGGDISESYSNVSLNWNGTAGQTPHSIGGFVGTHTGGNIRNCYSRSSIVLNTPSATPAYIGGFAGTAGFIYNSYASGSVCGGDCSSSTTDDPFAGTGIGNATNVYWSTTSSGFSSGLGGYGRTNTQMGSMYTYVQNVDRAFNFMTVWRIPSGGGLPIFQWQEPLGSAYTVAGLFAGGAGTLGSPYQIATENQLRNIHFAYLLDNTILSKYFILNSNISLTYDFPVIGVDTARFSGSFNGNNRTIQNLSITATADRVGLFGVIDNAGVVKDLNVTFSSINATSYNYVGVVAGVMYGQLDNVSAAGVSGGGTEVIQGNHSVGGVAGYYSGDQSTRKIIRSRANTFIVRSQRNGDAYMGGLVGYLTTNGLIEQSYSNVTLNWSGGAGQTPSNIGGFIGFQSGGLIQNCYSRSTISLDTPSATPTFIGGFAGTSSNILHSYATGSVCGGNCSNSGTDGPFAGTAGTLTNVYWSSTSTGFSSGSGIARTTTQMQDMYTYIQQVDNAFDFMNVWRIPSGGGLPIFQWQEALSTPYTVASLFAGGTGSSGNPWQISTEAQLRNMVFAYIIDNTVLTQNFILNSNIALTDLIHPLGSATNTFRGNFNGNNRTISNLTQVAIANYSGLFGYIGTGGVVRNLTLTISSIDAASYTYVGGLVGASSGRIENVHVRGVSGGGTEVIQGNQYVGGLVGYYSGDTGTNIITQSSASLLTVRSDKNSNSNAGGLAGGLVSNGIITQSFADTTVRWNGAAGQEAGYFGGFVGGMSGGQISNSYSRSAVSIAAGGSTPVYIGGFAGSGGGTSISNSYAAGAVCSAGDCGGSTMDGPFSGSNGIFNNVYWSSDATGFASGYGLKRTTVQMESMYTYTQNVDDSFNFMTIWRIPSGGGLPILQWQEPLGAAYTVGDLFAGGAGTVGSPYQIATENQLRNIVFAYQIDNTMMSKYFILTANISLTSDFYPIGSDTLRFAGNFDGDNYTIQNLSITAVRDRVGLFGVIESTGTVKDLNLTVSGISAPTYNYVGPLAGVAFGRIENVHVSGASGGGTEVIAGSQSVGGFVGYFSGDSSTRTISLSSTKLLEVRSAKHSQSYLGGFLGHLSSSGLIDQCFSNVTVRWNGTNTSEASYIGGFVGNQGGGTISNSYSRSSISLDASSATPGYVGGFSGVANIITNSYAIGNVCSGNCSGSTTDGPFSGSNGTFNSVFWNEDTAGGFTTGYGTKLNDTQFTQDLTANNIVDGFDSAGWSGAIWELNPANLTDYPKLKWEP